jgi:hypothetical protein
MGETLTEINPFIWIVGVGVVRVICGTGVIVSVGEGVTVISGVGERCPLSVGVGVKVRVGTMGVRLGVDVRVSAAEVDVGDGAGFGKNCPIEQAESRTAQSKRETNLMA